MRRNNLTTPKTRPWTTILIGLAGLAVLIVLFNIAISKAIPTPLSQQTKVSSPSVTSSVFVTASAIATQSTKQLIDNAATKMMILTGIVQTRTNAAKTPQSLWATIPPMPTGPTETPSYSDYTGAEHQFAGDGLIVFEHVNGGKNYPIGVIDFWVDVPRGNEVYAGFTPSNQGAITVFAHHSVIYQPELYLIPQKSSGVKIVDAQGQRLVLHDIYNDNVFYFDLPSRQFVESLEATVVAPTVTLWPTFTPRPTRARVPSRTPDPIGYPPPSNPTPFPTPPPQPTTTAPNPTASALPVHETGTPQP
jgi:hypothetical protein